MQLRGVFGQATIAQRQATRAALTREQKEETRWSQAGMRFRLRMETNGIDCSLDEVLALTTLREVLGDPALTTEESP